MKKIPFVKKRIAEEKKKILKDMEHSMNADVDGYVTQLPAEGLKMVFILIYFFKKQYIISEIYYHINSADIIKIQCNTI